jgi:hypothetical protein
MASAAAEANGGEGEELLLLSAAEAGRGGGATAEAEESWRLNFEGFRPPEAHQERPPTGPLHHCLGVLGILSLGCIALHPSMAPPVCARVSTTWFLFSYK